MSQPLSEPLEDSNPNAPAVVCGAAARNDEQYLAYGSNSAVSLIRSITHLANRSDSVDDLYRGSASRLCEYAGAVAARLYLVGESALERAASGRFFAPALDSHLQQYLTNCPPSLALRELHYWTAQQADTRCLHVSTNQTSALALQGVAGTLWMLVVRGHQLCAAVEFVLIERVTDIPAALERIAILAAEFDAVAIREHRFQQHVNTAAALKKPIQGNALAAHDIGNLAVAIRGAGEVAAETLSYSHTLEQFEDIGSLLTTGEATKAFVTHDPVGKLILPRLAETAQVLESERYVLRKSIRKVLDCTASIKNIVDTARRPEGAYSGYETVDLGHLCDLVLEMNSHALGGIAIERCYDHTGVVRTSKATLIRALGILITNAQQSIQIRAGTGGIVKITTHESYPDSVRLTVTDNGVGITSGDLQRIFDYGFSTKPHAFGYGLHAGLKLVRELGGIIEAASDGVGQGAEFQISIPGSGKGAP